ncbi:ABC transporter permease [Ruminococcus flavefaciens]|uniref:ABC-2 type transporter n=1 Tax=Ruminococcus flavefaciens TaxID=1265 RepID=A0A1M7JAQ0_RUMFL|nr:ABC transporter permease [Ruminococcus flavefaciens]SHM49998.1 ABC-2 type transporter [Ruminococcus flavefaciens]
MSKLLKVNISLMKYRSDVKICIVLGAILGVVEAVSCHMKGNLTWFDMFEMSVLMVMFLSAVGGLFISRDYTHNTIRNKLTVGHKRNDIYLANQITEILIFCLPLILYLITSVICNICFIGTKDLNLSAFLKNIVVCLFANIAISAVTTFIAMTVKSSAGGVLPIILMYPLLFFSVMAQEFHDIKWLKIINDINPLSQLTVLMGPDKSPWLHIFYSILISVIFILLGMSVFRKTDLK